MHFFGYGITDPKLAYHVADPSGALVLSEPVAVDVTTMIHDFAITDRDVVFWQGPVMFGGDPSGNGDPGFPFYWDPAGPSRVGVMPTIDRRRTGRSTRHGWFATIDDEGPYGFEFAGIAHRDS